MGPTSARLCLQVVVNILKLARSLASQNKVLFAACFGRTAKSLSMAILTKILQGTSTLLLNSQEKYDISKRRLDSVAEMTTHQLSELLPSGTDAKLPASARRVIGAKTLQQELKNWEDLLELSSLILESSTWLLWYHIEYYLQPKKKLLAAAQSSGNLSPQDVDSFKKVTLVNLDSVLLKKMNECEQV